MRTILSANVGPRTALYSLSFYAFVGERMALGYFGTVLGSIWEASVKPLGGLSDIDMRI